MAYTPTDWAEQLQHFFWRRWCLDCVVVQGALLPVAIALVHLQTDVSETQQVGFEG